MENNITCETCKHGIYLELYGKHIGYKCDMMENFCAPADFGCIYAEVEDAK